jgi:hypothetical protein
VSRSGNLPKLLDGADPGLDAPDVLRMQPMPRSLHLAHTPVSGGVVTSIMRGWDAKDVGRCRLCYECHASELNSCLVVVGLYVAPGDAALFEFPRPEGPDPAPRPFPRGGGR